MIRRLLTIGHSNLSVEQFAHNLARSEVSSVFDVRSLPYSRYNPQYNKEALEDTLVARGFGYLFMGAQLGARPPEASLYANGKVVYARLAQTGRFQSALQAVRQAAASSRIALMCSEKDPLTCHRCILICRHLRARDLDICHILDDGAIESHECAEDRLLGILGMSEPSLFETREERIERAYDLQGDRIAYVTDLDSPGAG